MAVRPSSHRGEHGQDVEGSSLPRMQTPSFWLASGVKRDRLTLEEEEMLMQRDPVVFAQRRLRAARLKAALPVPAVRGHHRHTALKIQDLERLMDLPSTFGSIG